MTMPAMVKVLPNSCDFNTVPVSAVRDLYGTLINEGASSGILITTSIVALNEQLREKAKLVGRDRFQLGKGKSRKHGTDLTVSHRIEGIVFLQDDEDMVFKLVVKPSTITDKGYFSGQAVIIDMEGQIVGEFDNLEGKGGVYGSFYNLMGDGYENVAEKIAGLIVSALNKGII